MTEAPRKDKRPTLTLKGAEFGPEFRNLVNKAAEMQGLTQARFVSEILTREAQRVVTGNPADTPANTPSVLALDDRRLAALEAGISDLRTMVERLAEPRGFLGWLRRA